MSEQTSVSTASLKYYLREQLLAPGEPVTRTQSEYSEHHVERVRLIRSLVEYGGLSLAQVRRVIEALDSPTVPRHDLLGTAQRTLIGDAAARAEADADPDWTALAAEFIAERHWRVEADDPLVTILGGQLKALVLASPDTGDRSTLDRWADAAELVADADLDTITDDDSASLRTAIVGLVLSDRVLGTLRKLAQQDRSARRFTGAIDGTGVETGKAPGDQTDSDNPDDSRR
ncbi:MerR family transcriptional regulator [Tsukamurella serpentis]